MRSLALLPLLTACYGKIEIGDDTANIYPAPDLMVTLASGPESSTVEAGEQDFEMACLTFKAAAEEAISGAWFKDNYGGGFATNIENAALMDGDTVLMHEEDISPSGDGRLLNEENPWVLPEGSESTACLVVDFQDWAGTSQVTLPPGSIQTENMDPYEVGGNFPFELDAVTIQ